MPTSREQFAQSVVSSGLLTADDLHSFWQGLRPDERPTDGEQFARRLVRHGKLTDFQAGCILAGKKTPLVLEPYVILSKLGAGGMGQVYKAQHRKMKRVVALKILPLELTKSDIALRRFQREVEAAARLIHPHIVTAFDAGEAAGVHFLVMEYVEGKDLAVLLRENGGPLSIDKALDYVLQAARGLTYAHGEGIIHRDVKPTNLLVDKRGIVKILDMGLARLDTPDEHGGLTQSGEVMGTIDYMAPEQALDTKRADARADVYSLGCTLYRLLTAEVMYESDTFVGKLLGHSELPIPSLLACPRLQPADDLVARLDAVYHKLVAKTPEERYQTMSEVVAELEGLKAATLARSASEGSGGGTASGSQGSGVGSPDAGSGRLAPQGAGPAISTDLGSSKSGRSVSDVAGQLSAMGKSSLNDETIDASAVRQEDTDGQKSATTPSVGGKPASPAGEPVAAAATAAPGAKSNPMLYVVIGLSALLLAALAVIVFVLTSGM